MNVLIVCTSTKPDRSIPQVMDALRKRGARPIVFDTARYPVAADISFGPDQVDGLLRTETDTVRFDELASVWIRHPHIGAHLDESLDEAYYSAVVVQSTLAVWDALACIPAFQLDPYEAVANTPIAGAQLRRASACGLEIPRTWIGNDVEAARRFIDSCEQGAICKMLHSSASKVPGIDGPEFVSTRAIRSGDLQYLDRLALCPMIFQEQIPKWRELRVTIVGDQVFAAAIDPRNSTLGAVDWRDDPALISAFEPWKLKRSVHESLLRLLKSCGLNFATADIIVTPEGRHVFLEINTISYFDFIEEATKLPISDAIADLLTARRRPRVFRKPVASKPSRKQ